MLKINENTRLLFVKAINDLHYSLQKYSERENANADYINIQNQRLNDLTNFYNEVDIVLKNMNFNGNIFNISNTGTATEVARLKAKIRKLEQQLYYHPQNANPYGY